MRSVYALSLCFALCGSATSQAPELPAIERAFKPGEEALWVFESAGKRIGHHASRFVGPETIEGRRTEHFRGSLRLDVPQLGAELLSTADLWTDGDGHPLRYVQEALVGTAYSRVEIECAGKGSKARAVQGSSVREIPLEVDPAAFLLSNNFVSHLEIYLALNAHGQDAKAKFVSASALQSFDYSIRAQGEFYQDSLGERLRMSAGRLVEIDVPAAKLLIRRSQEQTEPVRIVRPEIRKAGAGFDAEEVKVERDGARIAGTITRPKGSQGRLPAVFFVSGSGVQDRQGFSSGIDIGTHEILDRITSAGFLVLRVDDRGAGESSDMPPNTSFLDLVADARACVEFLGKRDDVDPARIALIGHSEGGETVPLLAAERPAIAAVVLLAAPGRPLLEIIADQNRLALEQQGLAREEIEKQMLGVRAFLARLVSDEKIDPAGLAPEELTALANRAWMQSHARQDPIATIQKLRCPVLVLQGALDFQVSPERDARALEQALAAAGNKDHELHVFDGLDHLFKRVPGEHSELGDYWKARPVDTQFLDTLTAWLQKRLLPEKK
jgi:pimeloyl-ACP methyl ester carboxylesterase